MAGCGSCRSAHPAGAHADARRRLQAECRAINGSRAPTRCRFRPATDRRRRRARSSATGRATIARTGSGPLLADATARYAARRRGNEIELAQSLRALGILDQAYEHLRPPRASNPRDGAAWDGLARIWRDWGFPGPRAGRRLSRRVGRPGLAGRAQHPRHDSASASARAARPARSSRRRWRSTRRGVRAEQPLLFVADGGRDRRSARRTADGARAQIPAWLPRATIWRSPCHRRRSRWGRARFSSESAARRPRSTTSASSTWHSAATQPPQTRSTAPRPQPSVRLARVRAGQARSRRRTHPKRRDP